jgi:hypothetical protein
MPNGPRVGIADVAAEHPVALKLLEVRHIPVTGQQSGLAVSLTYLPGMGTHA